MKQPHLRVTSKDVNDYCIIVGDPGRVERSKKYFTNSELVSDHRGFPVLNGTYKGVNVTVSSTGIGGPSAAIVIEELINCGAKVIIRVGSGGMLRKEMKTGDVLISTGVCKEEFATQAYVPPNFTAVPHYDVLRSLIDSAERFGCKYYYGPTMCTDGFYATSHRERMIEWADKGVIGSDMESAMLFTIAQLRGVKAGFIFYGGLNILNKQSSKDIIKQEKARRAGEKNAFMIALNAIKKLKGGD